MKLILALLLCSPASAQWLTSLEAAKKAAAQARRPILVDFQAVWCYSCYYMEERVLEKPAFKKAAEGLVLLKLDVDTEEGLALKRSLRVGFLPSYVLMDAAGRELGRIIGEQTEADFLAQLARLTGGGAAAPAARITEALDRSDLEAAKKARAEAKGASGPEWERASARLDLALALEAKRPAAAVEAFAALMRLGGACELSYHVFRAEQALAEAPAERRRAVLESARAALAPLVEERFFGAPARRCADGRSLVEAAAQVHEGLGDAAAKAALLGRAADELGRRVKADGVGADRNQDDDYRFFLGAAGRTPELLAHLERLVAEYPSDYVYPHRLARALQEAGRGAEALAASEKAYNLSYGANRFAAARLRAELLSAAGRTEPARELLRLELKAARSRFPDQAPPLEALLEKLGG